MSNPPSPASPWREVEITLESSRAFLNPYRDVKVWAEFTHASGRHRIRRPAFWDGGNTWKIRFASPLAAGSWKWLSFSDARDSGLDGISGTIECQPPELTEENPFYLHGFWRIPPGGRNLVYADGAPVLICADTIWAFPWRATVEDARIYATNRRERGFNAGLFMSIQPDMRCTGPMDRRQEQGFDVAFEDLPEGHLNQLRPEYFQYVDQLVDILVAHGIAPVWQPVFHGYGWKGLTTAGPIVTPDEYARYCRYLVARYGARPAVYLVSGDGPGNYPSIDAGGAEIETWDAYGQPTGNHYYPWGDNDAFQDRDWLDFQWCQTGHGGEHLPERVARMWRNRPVKAVANGEPSYEKMGNSNSAANWWQGHEAWSNLCSGGTMGLVYGAGSLWNWRLNPGEDLPDWTIAQDASWRDAIAFDGSRYVGNVRKIIESCGVDFSGMEPDQHCVMSRRCLLKKHVLLIVYLPDGGNVQMTDFARNWVPRHYRVYDAMTTSLMEEADWDGENNPRAPDGRARVVIFTER